MYLLQLVQALKYENFSDIQGGLEPGSKRDGQGLSDDSALDRSALLDVVMLFTAILAISCLSKFNSENAAWVATMIIFLWHTDTSRLRV